MLGASPPTGEATSVASATHVSASGRQGSPAGAFASLHGVVVRASVIAICSTGLRCPKGAGEPARWFDSRALRSYRPTPNPNSAITPYVETLREMRMRSPVRTRTF